MENGYLSYNQYLQTYCLGTPVGEDKFNKLIVRATMKFDYFTNNRLVDVEATDIPSEVKYTIAEFVNILNNYDIDGIKGLSSYSNGIESFSFAVDASSPEKTLNSLLFSRIRENLSKYPHLIYRGVSCG